MGTHLSESRRTVKKMKRKEDGIEQERMVTQDGHLGRCYGWDGCGVNGRGRTMDKAQSTMHNAQRWPTIGCGTRGDRKKKHSRQEK